MRLRSKISEALGRYLSNRYMRNLRRGKVWAVPLQAWTALSENRRNLFSFRIFKPVEIAATELMRTAPGLSDLGLPPANIYSLSPISRLVLNGLLERTKPQRILELGSGVSTLISAGHLNRRDGDTCSEPLICSLDHDEDWLEDTRKLLERAKLSKLVTFIHSPVEEQELAGGRVLTYSPDREQLEAAAGPTGFDLCLIDGPPEGIGRGGCLDLVAPYLADGATILLDDSFRPGEQAIWRSWLERYSGRLLGSRLLLTDRGMLMARWSRGPSPHATRVRDSERMQSKPATTPVGPATD